MTKVTLQHNGKEWSYEFDAEEDRKSIINTLDGLVRKIDFDFKGELGQLRIDKRHPIMLKSYKRLISE